MKRALIDFFAVVGVTGLISFSNTAHALPAECSGLTEPVTYIESTGVVCLQKIIIADDFGPQYYKASLQWLGEASPNGFQLINVEPDTHSVVNSPSYSAETGILTLPKVDIPKIYGTESYSVSLVLSQDTTNTVFDLTASALFSYPDYRPNENWLPYGLLGAAERQAVEFLSRSMPYTELADAVYSFKNKQVGIWELIEEESKDSGMQAGLYSNRDTGELVLAFRGTEACDFSCSFDEHKESFLDIAADALLTFGKDGPQFRHAFEFTEEVVTRYPDRRITVTGHSLGGGLAQAVGATFSLETFVFNSAPVPDDFFDDHPVALTEAELYTTIHVIGDIHDPVSNTAESGRIYVGSNHVSALIQFDFDEKEILPERLGKLDALRFNKHGMTKLIDNALDLLTIYHQGW